MAKAVYEDDPSDEDQIAPVKRSNKPVYEDEADQQVTAARSSNFDPALKSSESVGNSMKSTLDRQVDSVPMDKKAPVKMLTRPGQASSGMTKTPIVTLEQLGGMELRDYLNKQRGLTRRAEPNNFGANESKYESSEENIRAEDIMRRTGKRVPETMQYLAEKRNKRFPANTKKASGGAVKKMASGGSVSSASKRADGIAQRGKTKGKMC
jgi:hypothetical protein